jgi:ABC-type branched-subunit amino acid transport system ATPase component
MKNNMILKNQVKIEEGKITTLVGERCCGMTSLLCEYVDKFLKNNDGEVLIISYSIESVKHTMEKLVSLGCDGTRIDISSASNLMNNLIGTKYGMIIYDCPDIRDSENVNYLSLLRHQTNSKIIIGITWENIAFDKQVNKTIKKMFTNESDYAYYLTASYLGKTMFYEIENTKWEDLKEELGKLWG